MGEFEFRRGVILFNVMNGTSTLWKINNHILSLESVLAIVLFLADCNSNCILIFTFVWIG
jgi:hypothetical protein